MQAETIFTGRLQLEPITADEGFAALTGNYGDRRPAEGWPHADTKDGLLMPLHDPAAQMWLVLHDEKVIGDLGTHGAPDSVGDIELGYGLAAPSRGQGFGTEVLLGLAGWLLGRPEDKRAVARTVLADNTPSRRALERAGFELVREGDHDVDYALTSSPSSSGREHA